MKFVAFLVLAMTVLEALLFPFTIGRERAPRTAADYVANQVVGGSIMVALCGRVLGWW